MKLPYRGKFAKYVPADHHECEDGQFYDAVKCQCFHVKFNVRLGPSKYHIDTVEDLVCRKFHLNSMTFLGLRHMGRQGKTIEDPKTRIQVPLGSFANRVREIMNQPYYKVHKLLQIHQNFAKKVADQIKHDDWSYQADRLSLIVSSLDKDTGMLLKYIFTFYVSYPMKIDKYSVLNELINDELTSTSPILGTKEASEQLNTFSEHGWNSLVELLNKYLLHPETRTTTEQTTEELRKILEKKAHT